MYNDSSIILGVADMIFSFFILTFVALFPMDNSTSSELSLRNLAADYLLNHENLLKNKLLDEQTRTALKQAAVKKLIEKQDILSENSTFWVDCESQALDKIPWNSEIKYEHYYVEEKVEDTIKIHLGQNYSQRFDICYVIENIASEKTAVVYRDKKTQEFYYYFFTHQERESEKLFYAGEGTIICQTKQMNTFKTLYATIMEDEADQVTCIYNLSNTNKHEKIISISGCWNLNAINFNDSMIKLKKPKDGTEIVLAKFDPAAMQLQDLITAANAKAPRETLIELLLKQGK